MSYYSWIIKAYYAKLLYALQKHFSLILLSSFSVGAEVGAVAITLKNVFAGHVIDGGTHFLKNYSISGIYFIVLKCLMGFY